MRSERSWGEVRKAKSEIRIVIEKLFQNNKTEKETLDSCRLREVKLFPDWKPGVYQGQNVSVIFNLPVSFDLRN